jgi:DNA-binding transcriptional ArsR family regulator
VARKDAGLEAYRMQAEIAKALAHPVRLRILNLIGAREVPYGALLDDVGVSKANLSQHLAVLRRAGVLSVRRDGVYVHYRLRFPQIKDLCSAMRDILAKHLNESGRRARFLMRQEF